MRCYPFGFVYVVVVVYSQILVLGNHNFDKPSNGQDLSIPGFRFRPQLSNNKKTIIPPRRRLITEHEASVCSSNVASSYLAMSIDQSQRDMAALFGILTAPLHNKRRAQTVLFSFPSFHANEIEGIESLGHGRTRTSQPELVCHFWLTSAPRRHPKWLPVPRV
jgi:hypothetical protein